MRPEKKAISITDSEKQILEVLKQSNPQELGALKVAVGLSNKQWDKGMKGLSSHNLIKVEVDGDNKTVHLKA